MRQRSLVLAVVLMITALLLGACAQATPTAVPAAAPKAPAAQEPTQAPAAQAPTQAPAAQAPAASPAVALIELPDVNPLEVTGDVVSAGSSTVAVSFCHGSSHGPKCASARIHWSGIFLPSRVCKWVMGSRPCGSLKASVCTVTRRGHGSGLWRNSTPPGSPRVSTFLARRSAAAVEISSASQQAPPTASVVWRSAEKTEDPARMS